MTAAAEEPAETDYCGIPLKGGASSGVVGGLSSGSFKASPEAGAATVCGCATPGLSCSSGLGISSGFGSGGASSGVAGDGSSNGGGVSSGLGGGCSDGGCGIGVGSVGGVMDIDISFVGQRVDAPLVPKFSDLKGSTP